MLKEKHKKLISFAFDRIFILWAPEDEGDYRAPGLFDQIFESMKYLDLTKLPKDFLTISLHDRAIKVGKDLFDEAKDQFDQLLNYYQGSN